MALHQTGLDIWFKGGTSLSKGFGLIQRQQGSGGTPPGVLRRARGADYLAHYPGALLDQLAPGMSPFVRLEVGRARVIPWVRRSIGSFVHAHLDHMGKLADYDDNRPASVRCVHPLVTLLEKLDAVRRRYGRVDASPDGFVRHYEDAAQIVRAEGELPELEMNVRSLAEDMLEQGDIGALPSADDPAPTA